MNWAFSDYSFCTHTQHIKAFVWIFPQSIQLTKVFSQVLSITRAISVITIGLVVQQSETLSSGAKAKARKENYNGQPPKKSLGMKTKQKYNSSISESIEGLLWWLWCFLFYLVFLKRHLSTWCPWFARHVSCRCLSRKLGNKYHGLYLIVFTKFRYQGTFMC